MFRESKEKCTRSKNVVLRNVRQGMSKKHQTPIHAADLLFRLLSSHDVISESILKALEALLACRVDLRGVLDI
jgi:hypothetical protein